MEPNMNILFIGKKARMTKHQLLPIYLRVTIESKRFEVSTHQHVKTAEWSPSGSKVKGRSESALEINTELDIIKKQVYDYKEQILNEHIRFTVDALREKWFGEDRNQRTLLGVFRLSILDLEKLVNKGLYRRSTLVKYQSTEKHLIDYLRWRAKGCDVLLLDLRLEFASNFAYYLQA